MTYQEFKKKPMFSINGYNKEIFNEAINQMSSDEVALLKLSVVFVIFLLLVSIVGYISAVWSVCAFYGLGLFLCCVLGVSIGFLVYMFVGKMIKFLLPEKIAYNTVCKFVYVHVLIAVGLNFLTSIYL
jgi:hypothetical protein